MRRALILCLSMLLMAGTALAQQPEPSPRPKPRGDVKSGSGLKNRATAPVVQAIGSSGSIFVKENQWDFGHAPQNAKITHRFEVQNVGKDTLFIQKIKPT